MSGVVFTKRRSFCKARKHFYDQAKRAMYLLYKIIRNLKLSINSQLLEHTILPIRGADPGFLERGFMYIKRWGRFAGFISFFLNIP